MIDKKKLYKIVFESDTQEGKISPLNTSSVYIKPQTAAIYLKFLGHNRPIIHSAYIHESNHLRYHYFLVIRIFRLLRVFRILKLAQFNNETITLIKALKASSYKISIFFLTVLTIITLMGTIMYAIEGSENGFTSIPQSMS